MAAMPRQSPGGHHIVLYIAVAVGLLLAFGAAIALFRGLVSQTAQ
jgi:hypothetical protein